MLSAVAKILKHRAALFHHCSTPLQHIKMHFPFGGEMNVTLDEQIAVGEPLTRRYSSGHTQITPSAPGGVAGLLWR